MMKEELRKRLEVKKKELITKQKRFRAYVEDMRYQTFEDNAINSLLEMKKLKVEIEELEYILQLQMIYERTEK